MPGVRQQFPAQYSKPEAMKAIQANLSVKSINNLGEWYSKLEPQEKVLPKKSTTQRTTALDSSAKVLQSQPAIRSTKQPAMQNIKGIERPQMGDVMSRYLHTQTTNIGVPGNDKAPHNLQKVLEKRPAENGLKDKIQNQKIESTVRTENKKLAEAVDNNAVRYVRAKRQEQNPPVSTSTHSPSTPKNTLSTSGRQHATAQRSITKTIKHL
jgi:ribosomal protein S20